LSEAPQEVPEDGARPGRGPAAARLLAIAKTALTQQYSVLVYLIISFIVAQSIVVFLHYRTARLNHQVQEVQLARDLYKEFYDKENGYLQVANGIEACEKLYKGDGGKFGHLQMNQYLGFFEDLGLFIHPEVKSYIARIRKNFDQPDAFEDFDKVAKAIERDPRFVRLAQFAKTMCAEKRDEGD